MIRPVVLAVSAFCASAGLAGCVGDTRQASSIRANQAQLNAHGYTNNGPASWWWEWGFSRKGVGSGTGTKTPKNGPASSSTDRALSTTLKNLDPGQPYYVRACGQDQKIGSPVTCGTVLGFRTALSDSEIDINNNRVEFYAGAGAPHDLDVTGSDDGNLATIYVRELGIDTGTVKDASDVATLSDPDCAAIDADSFGFENEGRCFIFSPPSMLLTLAGGDDIVDAGTAPAATVTANLGGGNDHYYAGPGGTTVNAGDGNDVVYGGSGNDTLNGGTGNDQLHGGGGTNHYDCGAGTDVIYVSTAAEYTSRSTNCESYVIGP